MARTTILETTWATMMGLKDFEANFTAGDLGVISDAARNCSLAAGSASVYADLIHMLNSKMTDASWQLFYNDFKNIMKRIRSRGMTHEELVDAIFNVVFIRACRDSTVLKESVQAEMRLPK